MLFAGQPPSSSLIADLAQRLRIRKLTLSKRNLVENGGILDEIAFAAKTEDPTDLAYLAELLEQNPKYSAEYHHEKGINFSQMYGACVTGVICVKIDDDVLFIEDTTIRSIVKKKLEHPEYIGVSANIVVNFATAWMHNHLGAVYPYLPELDQSPANTTSWQVADLPYWKGPDDFDFASYEKTISAVPHHRWLPVAPDSPLAHKTPMDRSEYTLGSSGWHTWMVATQQHYSFLRNLEMGELWKYNFETWNAMYERVSINFFAISGEDIEAVGPMPGADEQFITMDYPRKTGRPFVIDGHGIAVHNGYASMSKKSESDLRVEGTDILSRYRLYARENVCTI